MINTKLSRWTPLDPELCSGRSYRGHSCPSEELVIFRVNLCKNPERSEIYVSLHPRAIKSAGWLNNDKILFEYSNGEVFVFRSNNGHKLGTSKNSARAITRFCIKTEYANLLKNKMATEVEIENGKIACKLIEKPSV